MQLIRGSTRMRYTNLLLLTYLLGLGLEAKFSGLGLETSGLGLVFLALALYKAKVKVTNILPNTVYLGEFETVYRFVVD